MSTKQTRTESELKLILMEEIREHPECSHITSVAITRPTDRNWDVAWGCVGPKAAPPIAYEIARAITGRI
jgi:hypothetical protein